MKTAITAILLVASTTSFAYAEVPAWVKNNAGWWADGAISDGEFVNGIQHLMMTGLISVVLDEEPQQMISTSKNNDSKLTALEVELEQCSEIIKAYDRLNCERDSKHEITAYTYKEVSQALEVGPITYY